MRGKEKQQNKAVKKTATRATKTTTTTTTKTKTTDKSHNDELVALWCISCCADALK